MNRLAKYKTKKIDNEKTIKAALDKMSLNHDCTMLMQFITRLDLMAINEPSFEYYDAKELVEILDGTKDFNELRNLTNNKNEKMAKEKYESSNVYNTIVNGKLALYCKEKTESSKEIKSASGVVKNYELFKSVSGRLTHLFINTQTINDVDVDFLVLYIQEDGQKTNEVIQTSFKGSYAQNFLMRLPNIDLSKEMKLTPYEIKDVEKSAEKNKEIFNRGISVMQDGEKIPAFFTKENPGDLPPMIEKKIKGKKSEWDMTDRTNFLLQLIIDKEKEIQEIKEEAILVEHENTDPEANEGDDLPF